MQGFRRKIVYVVFFELLAVTLSSVVLSFLSGTSATHTGPLAVMISITAMVWNVCYNYLFEFWESRQRHRTRTLARRLLHAGGFQVTFLMWLIPLISWWMKITFLEAFRLDLALIVFFPFFAFFYNWGFDRVFGVPLSAMDPAGNTRDVKGGEVIPPEGGEAITPKGGDLVTPTKAKSS